MIDETSRNSLARSAVFVSVGAVWFVLMAVMIKIAFWVSSDPTLGGIMSLSGDVATVFGFGMVYFRNPFFDKLKYSGKLSKWTEVEKKLASVTYDLLSYVIAWHAVAAIILRGDFLYDMFGEHAGTTLIALISLAFCIASIIAIKGFRSARHQKKLEAEIS